MLENSASLKHFQAVSKAESLFFFTQDAFSLTVKKISGGKTPYEFEEKYKEAENFTNESSA